MFLNGIDYNINSVVARNKELVRLVTGKVLTAHVIHHTPFLLVDLHDTSGPRQVNLVEELIHRKLVKRSTSHTLNVYSPGQLIAG